MGQHKHCLSCFSRTIPIQGHPQKHQTLYQQSFCVVSPDIHYQLHLFIKEFFANVELCNHYAFSCSIAVMKAKSRFFSFYQRGKGSANLSQDHTPTQGRGRSQTPISQSKSNSSPTNMSLQASRTIPCHFHQLPQVSNCT